MTHDMGLVVTTRKRFFVRWSVTTMRPNNHRNEFKRHTKVDEII